ncbi:MULTISPECIES: D-hexose-6-phosphate mutarotase [unclassified Pseudomonas]|uniref:D-hexose-6-phosphate mutarotase n=1 Tax=unclassified Pseudomonas TaxID=196821 RepID=UPI000D34E881|nr:MULTISPECIES: D-hexose-6-phosphate mutarotase [unclassified Pseudomonas]RAU48595.1 D-hexose-6-phosphate mutarotase [Pseudomonas sp. RIT 409]RAU54145.1 D-hexose-6-phosphate mutarotase [Pseudomonas sp. RIT 412]
MPTPEVESIQLGELNCWRIRHGQAELVVAQQGAHIVSYQVDGDEPLIWSNPNAVYNHGKAIRGGMPICWPWFGNFQRNPQSVQAMRRSSEPANAHGEVRAIDWELMGMGEDGEALIIEFIQPKAEGHLPGWPHVVGVKLQIRMDTALNVSLASFNAGDHDVTLSQALHTYFAVSDVHQISIQGLDGVSYLNTLESWEKQNVQAGDIRFTGETDRIYQDTPARVSIIDPAWKRRIEIQTQGSKSSVVWNPWVEKTKTFSDMGADDWTGMVCVETANVMTDVVTLKPGNMHVMGVSLWAEPLTDD